MMKICPCKLGNTYIVILKNSIQFPVIPKLFLWDILFLWRHIVFNSVFTCVIFH